MVSYRNYLWKRKYVLTQLKIVKKVEIVYVTYNFKLQLHLTRGGVEETIFQIKVKDSKKIRGQGPAFREETLSRPRTEDTIF